MPTEAQIRANRKNATKSTGPRTEKGKARVSKNALKHGLLAENSVIPGEDPAEFDRHVTLYEDTYNPRNCVEKALVHQIADAAWRIQRLSRIEATIITTTIERTRVYQRDFQTSRMREGHEGDLQLLGTSMFKDTKFLNNLARYDGHLNRRFHRSVELMMKIRKQERNSRKTPAKGDDGFDVYDSTAPPHLEHRYIPASPSGKMGTIPSADSIDSTHSKSGQARSGLSPIFPVAAPNRAANVSERYAIESQDPTQGSGPDDSPRLEEMRTTLSPDDEMEHAAVEQASGPAQAQPQKPQTPSNQSSSIARRTKKQRNKPTRTTRETRESREAIRDLRRRLTLIEDLGAHLER